MQPQTIQSSTGRLASAAFLLALVLTGSAASLAAGDTGSNAAVPAPSKAPAVGDPAPDFSLPYATADTIVAEGEKLSEAVKRGPVVLAFYPADWSPGCTKEVCTMRDASTELGTLGVMVWGVSGDNVYAHRAWAEQHKLPFRLLSDVKHDVAQLYDSFNPESGFNRRTVFVIGRDGRVAYADTEYSVKDDADFQALKAALAKMSG